MFSLSYKISKFPFLTFIKNMPFSIVKWCILNESQKWKLQYLITWRKDIARSWKFVEMFKIRSLDDTNTEKWIKIILWIFWRLFDFWHILLHTFTIVIDHHIFGQKPDIFHHKSEKSWKKLDKSTTKRLIIERRNDWWCF